MCAAPRAIYDACYPSDDWVPVTCVEPERCGTVHYVSRLIDRYGCDYQMRGAGVAQQGYCLLAGTTLGQAAPLWLAQTASDVRLGLTSTAVGLWQTAWPNRPAMVAFSRKDGQMLIHDANIALGHGMGIADAPLRSIVPAIAGSSTRWTDGAWTASYASGRSRDRRLSLNVASVATPIALGVEIAELIEQDRRWTCAATWTRALVPRARGWRR